VVHFVEQVLLAEDVTLLAQFLDLLSVDLFDCNNIASCLDLRKSYLPVRTFTHDFPEIKVIDRVLCFGGFFGLCLVRLHLRTRIIKLNY